jgi:hypothetical protein
MTRHSAYRHRDRCSVSQVDFDALNSSGLVSRNFWKVRPSGRVMSMVILGASGPLGLPQINPNFGKLVCVTLVWEREN